MQDTSVPTSILVARLAYCCDLECPFLKQVKGLHLVVEKDKTLLAEAQAVALSYTWGEFDRKSRLIGHDSAGTSVSLTLGDEWVLEEVIEVLAELCMKEGDDMKQAGIWMDQLCIPQQEAAIRETLARIPDIYRSLEVVALMPGSHCECLMKHGEVYLEQLDSQGGEPPAYRNNR